MTKHIHSLKLTFIAGLGSLALTACVPGQYAYDSPEIGGQNGQYQYNGQSAGYNQYGAAVSQSHYGYAAQNTGLRPACQQQAAPCGFMRVVPIYPIYQVEVPQAVPVPTYETYVEPPVVEIYEPEPIPMYEPEPEYTPMEHWPEPEAPIQSWQPLRK